MGFSLCRCDHRPLRRGLSSPEERDEREEEPLSEEDERAGAGLGGLEERWDSTRGADGAGEGEEERGGAW